MLLIYTHQLSSRVYYTFNLIFSSILGIDYEITTDEEKFRMHNGEKISYSKKIVSDEIFFPCDELLFEKGIRKISSLPTDPFALAFFLSSRYEEYLPFVPDKYGRFPATQSISYQKGILQKPIINRLANEIREKILKRYLDFVFPRKKYSFQPTVDIDNAYAYLGKNFVRILGGYARSIIKGDWDDFKERKKVLSNKRNDPYDTYSLQKLIHRKYNLNPIYFFLLGDWAKYDKNVPHNSQLMHDLIKNLNTDAQIGIHPSFASNSKPEKIKIEKERLETTTNSSITKSRQHFLILKFPNTYRNLIAAGIKEDYTMGYADEIGFRAGICTPFKWYDLEKEEETKLTIHPFAIMDGTLNNYLKLTPDKAIERTAQIISEIKKVNGEFILIWHNETLSDWREWKGWKNVYEEIIKLAI